MGLENDADHLRHLLSVARKLRGLAAEAAARPDRDLYAAAAAALEARARWLATHAPGDPPPQPAACRHVDIRV